MPRKYACYLVRYGRNPGIYTTWGQCSSQVDQYPGAVWEGCTSFEQARRLWEYYKSLDEEVQLACSQALPHHSCKPLLASLKASIRNNQTAFVSLQPVGTVFTGLHIMDDGWGHFSFGAAGWKTVVHALHLDIGDSILLEINNVTRANGVEFLMQIRRMDGQVHAWQPPPVPTPVPTPIPDPEETPPPAPSDSQDETSDSDVSSDSSDSQDAPSDSSGDDGDDDDVVEVDADGNEILDDDADYNSDYDPEEIVEGTQDAPIVLD